MITRFKIFEKNEDIDPFGEENWEEDLRFEKGDVLICVDPNLSLRLNEEYICYTPNYVGYLYKECVDVIDMHGHRFNGMRTERFKKKEYQ